MGRNMPLLIGQKRVKSNPSNGQELIFHGRSKSPTKNVYKFIFS